MKFRSRLLIINFLLLFVALGSAAQSKELGLWVKQGKKTYNLLALDSVVLQAKPFKYLVSFEKGNDIKLHHSYNDSLFNQFKTMGHHATMQTIPDWWAHCMAEESYNSDKKLILSNDGWSCWFYNDSIDFYRLDSKSIRIKNNKILGTKTIRRLFDYDKQNTILVKKALAPIYLIIAEEGKEKDTIRFAHTCKIVFK